MSPSGTGSAIASKSFVQAQIATEIDVVSTALTEAIDTWQANRDERQLRRALLRVLAELE
jgi:hypothetical protein